MAGTGGNGGGALTAARRLHTWGAKIQLMSARPAETWRGVPAQQLSILARLGIQPESLEEPDAESPADLVLDGLIGYSLKGAPRGHAAVLIRWANQQPAPVLSLDTPSGMEAGSGTVQDPCISARATLTLALPKTGLLEPHAQAKVGELYLADISVPHELYARPSLNLQVGAIFAAGEILRLN